ncbi:MAG: HEPN domain-containing protein [Candidatus Bathyarchaeia archaeon]
MERSLDLLKDAEDFLGAAEDLYKTGRWAKVCFNCQQSAELSLKAALNSLGLERRGNDLSELLSELVKYREELKRFQDTVKKLDQYYIPTRYANTFFSGSAMEHYTKSQAEEALQYARMIFREVEGIVAEREAAKRGR